MSHTPQQKSRTRGRRTRTLSSSPLNPCMHHSHRSSINGPPNPRLHPRPCRPPDHALLPPLAPPPHPPPPCRHCCRHQCHQPLLLGPGHASRPIQKRRPRRPDPPQQHHGLHTPCFYSHHAQLRHRRADDALRDRAVHQVLSHTHMFPAGFPAERAVDQVLQPCEYTDQCGAEGGEGCGVRGEPWGVLVVAGAEGVLLLTSVVFLGVWGCADGGLQCCAGGDAVFSGCGGGDEDRRVGSGVLMGTIQVRDLDIPVKIIDCEIARDFDGIALSSRNVRLSPEEREKALSISKSLARAKLDAENGNKNCKELKDLAYQTISEAGGRIEYVEIVEQESLQTVEKINCPVMMCVAAWFGNCRLIDNVEINLSN